MKRILKSIVLVSFGILLSTSCANMSNTAKGGAVGAGTGAAIGGILGNKNDNTAKGTILGAAIGGVTGAAIGKYMDMQKKDLEEELGEKAEVERIGEGLKVTFESGVLFDFNSSKLQPAAQSSIEKMVETFKEYPDTDIRVIGHTDSKGSDKYNQKLSEKRAKAVVNYAAAHGLERDRLISLGFGEEDPVAENDTETGRAENRRVEFAIYANEELKRKAEKGEI
ncbi:MAG: OmpA family protein [Flammeovirgaceae bacterium]|nr:OmpA family protein [Flammeovirgaceae bacterium]